MNLRFGNLDDNGVLVYAPNTITLAGASYVSPTDSIYYLAGYKLIIDAKPTDAPPSGQHYERGAFTEDERTITQTYTLVANPPAPARQWTPLAIKRATEKVGKWQALKTMLTEADMLEEFLMAQYIKEDDVAFVQMRAAATAIMGGDEAAVDAFIATIPQEA